MGISAQLVKQLRDMTGAGMMDCKRALKETDGHIDQAVEYLQKKGMAAAAKKASRVAAEGLIEIWLNDEQTEGVLVEINCETDFVARNEQFQEFAQAVAQTIGRSSATRVDELDSVKVAGGDKSLEEYTREQIATIGENIQVRRFQRFKNDQGFLTSYIHTGGQIGVMVSVKSERGASDDESAAFGRDIAMHVAAMKPQYLTLDDIPQGEADKWQKEAVLLEQSFVKKPDLTVRQLQDKIGGVEIVEFTRYEVGEGIEKEATNLSDEVAAQIGNA